MKIFGIKTCLLILIQIFITALASGQYVFTDEITVKCTNIKNQESTGTCWSFATTSFIESELMKKTGKEWNLSEMFIVKNIYKQKAINYILRQGKANFSQGSLAHDLIEGIVNYGIVDEQSFSGKMNGERYDHNEMEAALKGFLDGVIANKKPSIYWFNAFEAILDVYMGKSPSNLTYNNRQMSPSQYAQALGITKDDYIGLTSFSHHPYYQNFILEIPDNFSNGQYFNLPLEKLMKAVDEALSNGYTVAWDGDVSEKTFSAKNGIANLAIDPNNENVFTTPSPEITYDVKNRQLEFENWKTTDDHLMHIVGIARDQKGNKYYKVKNSWGEISDFKGFLYMSETYFKMKTVSVYLNKAGFNSALLKP